MKVKKSELKTCRVAYLHTDGHLVLIHEKKDKDAGKIEYATIYENVEIQCSFEGRLIIESGALPFVLESIHIRVLPADLKQGSDLTREKGIRVETLLLKNKYTSHEWIINFFPDFISSDIKYQKDMPGKFEDVNNAYYWSNAPVKKIYFEEG
jgi:hypothetical protein